MKIRYYVIMILMLCICFCSKANAKETIEANGKTFTVEGDELTISGEGELSSSDLASLSFKEINWLEEIKTVVIEPGITGIADETFAEYTIGLTSFRTITIPNTVKTIGYRAFFDCVNLVTIELSDGVESIQGQAFTSCWSLTRLEFPKSISYIDSGAFGYTRELLEFVVDENNPTYSSEDGILYSKDMTEIIAYPGGRSGEVIIHDGVTKIGNHAFAQRDKITNVKIPSSVLTIEEDAFFGSTVSELEISDGLERIESGAFSYCDRLSNVDIPKSVNYIDNRAFNNCYDLISINVEDSNATYSSKDGVLYNKNLTEIIIYPMRKKGYFTIPDTVTIIGSYAFCGCPSLTGISIPDSVIEIGECAFLECSSLTEIEIPISVRKMGVYALDCDGLKTIFFDGKEDQWKTIEGLDLALPFNDSVTIYFDHEWENQEHIHSLIIIDAKAATTTSEGYTVYYTCTSCGKYFSDAAGTNEITKDSWIIPKLKIQNNGVNNNNTNLGTSSTTKQDQPMTVKASKKTVKVSKLKKKAQTVKPITVKSAQGTVTYKITGGNKKSKKALKVNVKNGKITVKKKTKKGTYKVKVTVTASGNKNYKSGSKTVTVKVVVK